MFEHSEPPTLMYICLLFYLGHTTFDYLLVHEPTSAGLSGFVRFVVGLGQVGNVRVQETPSNSLVLNPQP